MLKFIYSLKEARAWDRKEGLPFFPILSWSCPHLSPVQVLFMRWSQMSGFDAWVNTRTQVKTAMKWATGVDYISNKLILFVLPWETSTLSWWTSAHRLLSIRIQKLEAGEATRRHEKNSHKICEDVVWKRLLITQAEFLFCTSASKILLNPLFFGWCEKWFAISDSDPGYSSIAWRSPLKGRIHHNEQFPLCCKGIGPW